MNLENQIPEEELQRIGAAYASVCLERPSFLYRLTGWEGDAATRLVLARQRLLDEFDCARETTLDDLVGLELAECYKAYGDKDFEKAVERLERTIAILFRGIRMVKMQTQHEETEETEDSNG